MSCTTSCDLCLRKFLNSRSLYKHRLQKHGIARPGKVSFRHSNGELVDIPKPVKLRAGRDKQAYQQWLCGVVERINGAHHPKFPGRWFRIEINQTPKSFFSHILWKLALPVYSAKKTRHLRQPLLALETMRYSYKFYDVSLLTALLSEQNEISLKLKTAFLNEFEVDIENEVPEDPMAALELAKARANTFVRMGPTSRSCIVVGEGEGRATREFELQWWPQLYHTDFGKLCLRFYVDKVQI